MGNIVNDSSFHRLLRILGKVILSKLQRTWVYQSHSQRAYPQIYYACKCYNCTQIYWFADREEFGLRYHNEIEEEGIDKVMNNYLEYYDGKPTKDLDK